MVVGAAEDDIARLERVMAPRIADPASHGNDSGADAELGDLAGDDLDLRAQWRPRRLDARREDD